MSQTDPPDLSGLARDWITIWQSELAATAVDVEAHESLVRLAALWAQDSTQVASSMMAVASPDCAVDDISPRPAAAPRPATAAAASDPRDAEIDRLTERVRELEQRLGRLEAGC
jgi:hypothetical protein